MKELLKKNKLTVVLFIILALVGIFFLLIDFITDWMWFAEMGYVDVFLKQLVTELKVGIPAFIIISLLMRLYLGHIKNNYFKKVKSHEVTNLSRLSKITTVIAIIFGALTSVFAVQELWFKMLQFANASGFDIKDPLFDLDISFYIFKLEFLTETVQVLIGLIVCFILATVIFYGVLVTVHTPDIMVDEEEYAQKGEEAFKEAEEESNPFKGTLFEKFFGKSKSPRQVDHKNLGKLLEIAKNQICIVIVIFFVMLGINFFLEQFDLLHAHTGVVYGAGFTDVNIKLWMIRALIVLSLVGAVVSVIKIKKKEFVKVLYVPAIMIAVALVGNGVALLAQNFIVSPDEINKEDTYLENNIKYTQLAYDLDNITIKSYTASPNLSAADLDKNTETITNIRINDYNPVKTFYNQTQSIRKYYTFNDVDVDRYYIDGELTQTFLATREIDENKISDTWLNRHIKYTHGYGVTLSRVDTVTSSGQADVLIGNIPSESSVKKDIDVKNNAVYFGESTNDYILVNTDEKEFDYPDGDSNRYTNYEGNAGIRMNFLNRLLFSVKERSLKMLVSSNISSDSRIVINRNIMTRIQTIMPFLKYDSDPYLVTVDGNLYWIVDAYTTSSYYPYSEPYVNEETGESVNYIRNSIKVVVDAYNGNTDFYIVDENDPIAQTYAKIYPTLFKAVDKMDEGLKAHIRYPNYLFDIQAQVYGKYHMSDVKVFYQSEDNWDIANETYGTDTVKQEPSYYIYKLPGEKQAEFVSSVAYTPQSKQNMTALLVARSDGENYGKFVLYQFPKSKTVYGPEQVEAMIDQNTEISKEFSLWNSSGSKYSRGNLFIIPIEDSIVYVEPVYLEATNSSIPEVKRVIVVFGDKISYKETLGEALADMFGDSDVTKRTSGEDEDDNKGNNKGDKHLSQAQLIDKAVQAYNNAVKAQESGDWSKYGKYLDQLEEYLNKLNK
ncbi:MAG: UPF0182 family protein [Clostridia bacterium]|nr:UPF0182 family protein [Clostridia bacterium]